jgi:hypothetical protein
VISAVKKIASLMVAKYWVGRHPEKVKRRRKRSRACQVCSDKTGSCSSCTEYFCSNDSAVVDLAEV